MKKVLVILAIFASIGAAAQKNYVSASYSYYNGAGTFGQQSMVTVEVGRDFGNVCVGIAGGVTAFTNGNAYVEARVSPTLWKSGRWSVSGSLGVGHIIDAPTYLLTEYGGSVNCLLGKNVTWRLSSGAYNFNGKNVASKATYVGTGFSLAF